MKALWYLIAGAGFAGIFTIGMVQSSRSSQQPPHDEKFTDKLKLMVAHSEELDRDFADLKLETLEKKRVIEDLRAGRIAFYEALEAFREFQKSRYCTVRYFFPECDDNGEELAYQLLVFRLMTHTEGDIDTRMAKLVTLRR